MQGAKNKNMWMWIIGVLALVVVIVLIIWSMNKNAIVPNENGNIPEGDTSLDANLGMEDITPGSVNTGSPAVTISYANALIKYKDARLQLDKTCQGSPDKMTFKDGSILMVDNRASVARTVKVGSVFSIAAYGFKLVKLTSATLPATWMVDCDKSQNVSTILIQK